jgi:hypothetical protein
MARVQGIYKPSDLPADADPSTRKEFAIDIFLSQQPALTGNAIGTDTMSRER